MSNKSNILFLFTDDQQFDTIHALGNDKIKTPNIDKLVEDGIAFTNSYIMGGSSPAVCSPSRACLFSGKTLWNIENQGIFGYEISKKNKTFPQVFRENGYTTFATGKNEPGREGHFARSFSCGDKILFRGMSNQYKLPLNPFSKDGDYSKEKEVIHEGKHSAEVYADACIDFLNQQKDESKPFFAYVAFQTPHDPRECPDEFMSMYNAEDMDLPASYMPMHPFDNGMLRIRDEELEEFPRTKEKIKKHISDYYAMVTHTDAQVGRILDALEKSGKKEETIIVFSSDNGLAVGKHGLMGKQNVYDHAVHVPLIISGPGIAKNKRRNQMCYIYDIYPTLCELTGIKIPAAVEYKSLFPIIKIENEKHRNHLTFGFMDWQRAVRTDDYKLIEYCVDNKRHTQLFDLKNDPDELNNIAQKDACKETLEYLRKLLKEERIKLNDGNTPYEFSNKQGVDFWNTYKKVKEVNYPHFT